MKNMKLSRKLISSFLIVISLTVIVGGVGVWGLLSMGNAADTMYAQKALPLGDLAAASEKFQRCRIQARNAVLYAGDAEKLAPIESDIVASLADFESSMEHYKPSIQTEVGFRLYSQITDNLGGFKSVVLQVVDHAKQGLSQEALLAEIEVSKASTELISSGLSELITARMGVMSDARDANEDLKGLLLIVIIALVLTVVLASILISRYISGLISKPLIILNSFMRKAGATGDITLRPEDMENISKLSKAKDEIGQLVSSTARFVSRITEIGQELDLVANGDLTAELPLLSDSDTMGLALRKMLENLNRMFGEINASASQVSTGSKQIADGAQSLAQGSTEQASAIEELLVSIGDIKEKTLQNTTISKKAADLSGVIRSNAEKGSTQMDQMMRAVTEINASSSQIGKVIKVIDDIAFQTNILALNAAVEAARAGAHGKGFAVVAEEVRNLAAKSAEAARDTGSLIENSIEKAGLGLTISTETAASLKEIVEGINQSAEIISQIARSSEEQASAIGQINTGIDQVAQVIQQNSATAEESAATSEEMSGQARMLNELISQFKLNTESPPSLSFGSDRKSLSEGIVLPSSGDENYGKY